MTVTLKDIAKLLGVSHTTVYRAVNNKPGVSEDTRRKVLQKVEELSYVPNVIARGLVSKRTSFVGVIVPFIESIYFSQAIQGVEDIIKDFGYDMILCTTRDREATLLESIQVLKEKMVEGMIVAPGICCTQAVEGTINDLYTSGMPMVVLNVLINSLKAPIVVGDDVRAGYLAAKHLIDQGRNRILHVHGPPSDLTSRHRFSGYYSALVDSLVDFDSELVTVVNGYSSDIGYQAVYKALKSGVKFSAIYAYCDELALGAYRALKEFDLRVPEDVALVGNDNSDVSVVNEVPITTVGCDKKQLGMVAAKTLLAQIDGGKGETVIIEPELIVRKSSEVALNWEVEAKQ